VKGEKYQLNFPSENLVILNYCVGVDLDCYRAEMQTRSYIELSLPWINTQHLEKSVMCPYRILIPKNRQHQAY